MWVYVCKYVRIYVYAHSREATLENQKLFHPWLCIHPSHFSSTQSLSFHWFIHFSLTHPPTQLPIHSSILPLIHPCLYSSTFLSTYIVPTIHVPFYLCILPLHMIPFFSACVSCLCNSQQALYKKIITEVTEKYCIFVLLVLFFNLTIYLMIDQINVICPQYISKIKQSFISFEDLSLRLL